MCPLQYLRGLSRPPLYGAKCCTVYRMDSALRRKKDRNAKHLWDGMKNLIIAATALLFVSSGFAYGQTVNPNFVGLGTGAVSRPNAQKHGDYVSVKNFGAEGDGLSDDYPAIAAAFKASNRVMFPAGTYLMKEGITKLANNIEVDFGNAKLVNSGVGFLFTFGATADMPTHTGLKIYGGHFTQSNPLTTNNYGYIRIKATKNFEIRGSHLQNVSNGGIYVEAGSEDGIIDAVTIIGKSGYSTIRGIWINGSTASDYAGSLVDISSITRNAVPMPVYAAKNIKISNSTIKLAGYGIYLMNTRDARIERNEIDISGSGARCIAVNNFSPGALIKGNILVGDQSSTGVLITQASSDVQVEGNVFNGTFGGGRDIYVAYLAHALITNNRFNTDSSQNILINMGGTAVIRGNYFTRSAYSANTRAVKISTIDEAVAGTRSYGNMATTLPGVLFQGNTVRKRVAPMVINTPTAQNGNIPGLDVITVRDNVFYDFDTATGSEEYGMRIYANGTNFKVKYAYFGNKIYPEAKAGRNRVYVTGAGK